MVYYDGLSGYYTDADPNNKNSACSLSGLCKQ